MKYRSNPRPTLALLALATLVASVLAAFSAAADPNPGQVAHDRRTLSAASVRAAGSTMPTRHSAMRRQLHSLQMPFFSFQPLG